MAKIMIVEDDNNLRAIYGDRLLAEGYEVVSASDGEEALAIAVKEKPDLIISDVMMPKISGFDMLDILRSTPETKDTKVIMMTALSQAEDKERADKLGADKYLVKSQVTLDDVARVVNEVIAKEGGGAPIISVASTTTPTPAGPAPTSQPVIAAPATAPTPSSTKFQVPGTPVVDPVTTAPEPTATYSVTPPAPQPVATPAPTDDDTSVKVDEAAEEVAKDAEAVDEEKADISAQIENFISTNVPEPVEAPAPNSDPSAQDHAMNALQSAPADAPASEPVFDPSTVETTEPAVETPDKPTEEAAPALDSAPAAEEPEAVPDPSPSSISKKVIAPIGGSAPSIYDLYEKEMATEAATAAVETPPSGTVIQGAPEEPETPPLLEVHTNPIVGPAPSNGAPDGAVVMPVAAAPADPVVDDSVPHKDDPGAIAL